MRQLLTLVESVLVIWMKLFVVIVLGFVALNRCIDLEIRTLRPVSLARSAT